MSKNEGSLDYVKIREERDKALTEIRKERLYRVFLDTSKIYRDTLDRLIHYSSDKYLELKYKNMLEIISSVYMEVCGFDLVNLDELDKKFKKELDFTNK